MSPESLTLAESAAREALAELQRDSDARHESLHELEANVVALLVTETECAGDELLAHLVAIARHFWHAEGLPCVHPSLARVFAAALVVKFERAGQPVPSSWTPKQEQHFRAGLEAWRTGECYDDPGLDEPTGGGYVGDVFAWLLDGCQPPTIDADGWQVIQERLDSGEPLEEIVRERSIAPKWASDLHPRRLASRLPSRRPRRAVRRRRRRSRSTVRVRARSPGSRDDDPEPSDLARAGSRR